MEILSDSLPKFAGIIIGLVGIALSVLFHLRQHRLKKFSYQVVSQNALLDVHEEITNRVRILLDGNPIKDAHLVIVKIINSGNLPIPAQDHERAISLQFGDQARVLSCEIVDRNPKSLQSPKIHVDESQGNVTLEPVLMNGGDFLSLKVLVSRFGNRVDVDARIIGVKDIKELSNYRRHPLSETVSRSFLSLTILMLASVAISIIASSNSTVVQLAILTLGVSAVWFVGRVESWRRWGYVLGLCSQPFWFYLSIKNGDWGIFVLNCLYTYSWCQGVWFHWIQKSRMTMQ